jgi:hypothetical protein
VRPDVGKDTDERELIEEAGRPQLDAVQHVLDTPEVGRARAARDADDLLPLLEEQLGQIRPSCPVMPVMTARLETDNPKNLRKTHGS